MSESYIEYEPIECPNHNPDNCECDNGIVMTMIDHGYAEPEYEPDYEAMMEARWERDFERWERFWERHSEP